MNYLYIGLTAALSLLTPAHASIQTYPGAIAEMKSPKYQVTILQKGRTVDSFVYADSNKFEKQRNIMTDWNHWTTFSFSDPITIRVKSLAGDIPSATIYPLARNIQPAIKGDAIEFKLKNPAKLYIAIPGMEEDPLFIFADAPETNIPNRNDPNVVWFAPGVHNIDERYKIKSNTTYYLEGGAYLKGSFYGMECSNVTIRGRGILSGETLPHFTYKHNEFRGISIHFDGNGTNQSVEGITIINPSMYCIQSYCGQLTSRNIKCFGWWYETDGWVGGPGSLLEDAFFKVNDDVVKLYNPDSVIRDIVIYQQFNGSPFQLGWGTESGQNITVENIDIVHCEVFHIEPFNSNRTLINRRRGSRDTLSKNIRFNNIRVDQNSSALIGISTSGQIENIEIQNVTLRGKQKWPSYLDGNINGIHFKNITIDNQPILRPEDIGLQTKGSVTNITFQ